MIWDVVIIVLSVYNSIILPYQFAYSMTENSLSQYLDRLIDSLFLLDIVINFRTVYENSEGKKDRLERDTNQNQSYKFMSEV